MFPVEPAVAASYKAIFRNMHDTLWHYDVESNPADFDWVSKVQPRQAAAAPNSLLLTLAEEQDQRHSVQVFGVRNQNTFAKGKQYIHFLFSLMFFISQVQFMLCVV